MRLKGLVLLAIVPVLLGAAMPVTAQTLADLAKKEEDRRKKIPEPAKVYTNKDLGSVPPSSTPPPATSSTAGAPAGATTPAGSGAPAKEEESKEPVKDQKYWGGRLKSLQDNLSRDEGYAEAMQTRLNSLQTDFVNRDDPAQRAVIERDRNKVQSELERLKKSIVDQKKGIADFMEEARRAGVPPGWLR
jgi:hypothetical protein